MHMYVIESDSYIKIGIARNVTSRLKGFSGGSVPFDVFLAATVSGDAETIRALEKHLLRTLTGRLKGEWFCKEKLSIDDVIAAVRTALTHGHEVRRASRKPCVRVGRGTERLIKQEAAQNNKSKEAVSAAVKALWEPKTYDRGYN